MRMDRVDASERSEELAGLQLEIERQTGRLQKCFLNFNFGLVIIVEFENDVGETFKVRIDRSVERELGVPRIESALLRIVVANFDAIEIARARSGEREQSVEGNVHIIF